MKKDSADCRNFQAQLVEHGTAGGSWDELPAILRDHVRDCRGCGRYARGLRSIPDLFPPQQLYSETLRMKALARIGRESAVSLRARTWALLTAEAVAGLVVWAIAPLALVSCLIGHYRMLSIPVVLLSSTLVSIGLVAGLLVVVQVSPINLKPERTGLVQRRLLE